MSAALLCRRSIQSALCSRFSTAAMTTLCLRCSVRSVNEEPCAAHICLQAKTEGQPFPGVVMEIWIRNPTISCSSFPSFATNP